MRFDKRDKAYKAQSIVHIYWTAWIVLSLTVISLPNDLLAGKTKYYMEE